MIRQETPWDDQGLAARLFQRVARQFLFAFVAVNLRNFPVATKLGRGRSPSAPREHGLVPHKTFIRHFMLRFVAVMAIECDHADRIICRLVLFPRFELVHAPDRARHGIFYAAC